MTGLVSGEGVSLELQRAGLGTRTIAGAIDLAAQLGLLLVAAIVIGLAGGGDTAAQTAVSIAVVVLIFAGYPIVFEWLGHGQTLGKHALGLRVVRDDAGPIGFRQAFVRGLAGFFLDRFGLLGPLGLAIGMITIGTSETSKRIGDMMGGTFVINERVGPSTALQPIQLWVPPVLHGWAQSLDLSAMSDQLALRLRQFIQRAGQMSPGAQLALGEQFRAQVLAVISPLPPPGVPTPVLLATVLAERRRQSDNRGLAVAVAPPGPARSNDLASSSSFAPPG